LIAWIIRVSIATEVGKRSYLILRQCSETCGYLLAICLVRPLGQIYLHL
jgi:hypothetical protein